METLMRMGIADTEFWTSEVKDRVTRPKGKKPDQRHGDHGAIVRESPEQPVGKDAGRRQTQETDTDQGTKLTKGQRGRINRMNRPPASAQVPPPAGLAVLTPPAGAGTPAAGAADAQHSKGGKAAGKGGKPVGKGGKDMTCRQWAATGTCFRGANCWFAASHR